MLQARATAVGADTALSQLVALVERAQASKPQIQRLADEIARVFVPVVIVLAALTALAWMLTGQGLQGMFASMHLQRGIDATIAVLIVACPCALGLATPVAILVGTGRGARLGLLIRGAEILERSQHLDTIVLDKTGTVTTGELSVADIWSAPGEDPDQVLALAAVRRGRLRAPGGARDRRGGARARPASSSPRASSARSPGAACARCSTAPSVWVGRPSAPAGRAAARVTCSSGWEADGRTAVVVERGAADPRRDRARGHDQARGARGDRGAARMGIDVELLTGDNPRAAHAVAAGGRHRARARRRQPERQARGDRAAAGARATASGWSATASTTPPRSRRPTSGSRWGPGVGAAIEAADISVLSGDLRGVARALRLARETYTIVLQNLGWAFGYNLIALPLAMTGLLSPALAAVAMGLSSITVVTNSLRLRRFGAPGRPTPVRSRRQRLASIATAAAIPAVLLGGLVLGDPNSFAVPRSASITLAEPAGETLEVYAEPLRPGNVNLHLYLEGTTSARVGYPLDRDARHLRRRAAHANVNFYTAGTGHEIAEVRLTRGVWDFHVAGADAAGRPLRGSFALPIN